MAWGDDAVPSSSVTRAGERIVEFSAEDGRTLRLSQPRGASPGTRGPVLLVHGAGVRSNIFRPPVQTTFVDALIEHGYDPWLLDWRASLSLPETRWTLDQAAAYDYPSAVRVVLRETGWSELKAVVHCQGSTSFMMALVAGLLPEVRTVVSNAVSLHPVVPTWSRFKLNWMVPMVGLLTDHLNPHWGVRANTTTEKAIAYIGGKLHPECDNTVCNLVSFSYGTGFPALWSHAMISEQTHEWLKEEFGFVPFTFHRQMARCVNAGHLVSVDQLPQLPRSFVAEPPKTEARIALFAGRENRCFSYESQERTHAWLTSTRTNKDSLHILDEYGHLDMFLGENAARDVFPRMIQELDGP